MGRDWPLVIVGDAPYAERYIADLKAAAGPDVRFPGYVFGDGLRGAGAPLRADVRADGGRAAPTR